MPALTSGLAILGGIIGGITLPMVLMAAAIAALIAIGVLLYKNWDLIKEKAIELFETVKTALVEFYENNVKPILEAVGAVFTWVWESIIKPVIDKIVAYYKFWYDILFWVWNSLIYPILTLIAAIFLRIFHTIFTVIKTNLEKTWAFWKGLFETIWAWVKPWLELLASFIKERWENIKRNTQIVWNWIKEHILKPLSDAWDGVVEVANSILSFIETTWNGIVSFLKNVAGKIIDAIVEPFRKAKEQVEEWARKIREVAEQINPFHRESPSLVDNVRAGVKAIQDAYTKLGMSIEPNLSGVTNSRGGNTVIVNMAGAYITDSEVAEDYAEKIGDQVIRKLSRVARTM